MRRSRTLTTLAALAVTSCAVLTGLTAAPSYAAACPKGTPKPTQQLPDTPWPQTIWDLARLPVPSIRQEVRVAVLDSGVDAENPQLKGQVVGGIDKLRGGDGRQDCLGHGTGVASLIAGKPVPGSKFQGIAPSVKILSARISEKIAGQEGDQANAVEMAQAVDWAVLNGAKVINLSLTYSQQSGQLDDSALQPFKSAIARAVAQDVVIVAAVGNAKEQGNPLPYPASWPGVIGVGAITRDGQRLPQSQTGAYVDLVAPGGLVTMASVGGGQRLDSGTSFAAPLVAGTAALIRQAFPRLNAGEVITRLLATADPAPGGGKRSPGYGVGVLNPVRALTEVVDGAGPAKAQPYVAPSLDPAVAAAQERSAQLSTRAWWIAGIGVLAAVLALMLTTALPSGARRRWRPAGRESAGRDSPRTDARSA